MLSNHDLLQKKSRPTETALADTQLDEYLAAVGDWTLTEGKLCKTFSFGNYYEALAFVNALAYLVHAEDHHPELVVTYNRCQVRFDTHSVNNGAGGLSENDFICAAKVDAIATHTCT